jgi:hypothetical protein
VTEQDMTDAMTEIFGHYCRAHPEIAKLKVVCEDDTGGLLVTLYFSRPPSPAGDGARKAA